jgi:mono/diheme cytochrome c family protein
MNRTALILPALALALALAACQTTGAMPQAAAPEAPAIVASVCADCHAVQPPFLSPNGDAPPFDALANRTGLTRATLTDWLRDAHNYPDLMEFALDEAETAKVADYILALKEPDYRPAQ